jgi:hypothetical protein
VRTEQPLSVHAPNPHFETPQAAEKDAIGNEPGKRACTFVSSGDHEREDEEGVEKQEGGDRNEEPRPDAHASSLVLVYADQEAAWGRRLHELALVHHVSAQFG